MLAQVDMDAQLAKENYAVQRGPAHVTDVHMQARKSREAIRILFRRYSSNPVRTIRSLRGVFGGEEDQLMLHREMAYATDVEITHITTECRRYLCLYLVHMLLEVLYEQGCGNAVRRNLQEEIDAARGDAIASGAEEEQIPVFDPENWMALQLERDVGFAHLPDSRSDSIEDPPLADQ